MINKNIRMFKKYMKMISNKRVNKRKGEYSATNNEKSVGNGLNQCQDVTQIDGDWMQWVTLCSRRM